MINFNRRHIDEGGRKEVRGWNLSVAIQPHLIPSHQIGDFGVEVKPQAHLRS
ncbi:MAG: hypothetical protein V7K43_03700 [Nostoc sp.]